jgi:presenilin-like A22 family membrane protease
LERRIEIRQLANILVIFLVVQFAGLLILVYSTPIQQLYITPPTPPPTGQAPSFFFQIIIYLIIFVVLLLLIFRVYHGNFLFKAIEAYAIGLPSFYVFVIILTTIFPSDSLLIPMAVVSVVLAIALIAAKNKWPRLLNIAAMIASIGIGLLFGGIFGFLYSYILFALFTVYDYIAVFVTRHMQFMAKELANRNLAFLVGSSETEVIPSSHLSEKDRQEFKEKVAKEGISDPVIKKIVKKGNVPAVSRVALGTGDLAFPFIIVTGAYVSFRNTFIPLMVIVGATLGLVVTMQILKRYKVPLPALPPLFAFISLFLAICFVVLPPYNYSFAALLFVAFLATMIVIQVTLNRLANNTSFAEKMKAS